MRGACRSVWPSTTHWFRIRMTVVGFYQNYGWYLGTIILTLHKLWSCFYRITTLVQNTWQAFLLSSRGIIRCFEQTPTLQSASRMIKSERNFSFMQYFTCRFSRLCRLNALKYCSFVYFNHFFYVILTFVRLFLTVLQFYLFRGIATCGSQFGNNLEAMRNNFHPVCWRWWHCYVDNVGKQL